MSLLWLLGCVAPTPRGTPTDHGRYRVEVRRTPEGVETLLSAPDGRAVRDAMVEASVQGLPAGSTDPGECDSVGPERCSHPGGLYLTRIALPPGPVAVHLVIDGPLGEDTATITPDR